jgi:hypothetical protein
VLFVVVRFFDATVPYGDYEEPVLPTIVYPEGLAESELGCLKLYNTNTVLKLEQV